MHRLGWKFTVKQEADNLLTKIQNSRIEYRAQQVSEPHKHIQFLCVVVSLVLLILLRVGIIFIEMISSILKS